MDNNNRDFNAVAKVLLGLSMFAVTVAIITSIQKISINSYLGGNNGALITEIIIDFLILGASVLTFMKKKYGLIALTLLFIIRMFATIPSGGDIAYSYQLGGKMAFFLRDFGLFAIAMCFKKNGVSGWKAFYAKEKHIGEINIVDSTNDLTSSNQNSGSKVIDVEQEEVAFDNEKPSEEFVADKDILEKTKIDSDAEAPEEIIIDKSRIKLPKVNIKVLLPSVVGVLCLLFLALILFKTYPNNIESFGDKFKYFFGLPNDNLSAKMFDAYKQATDAGFDETSYEYLSTAYLAKPNDIALIDSIAANYYKLGRDTNVNDSLFYARSAELRSVLVSKEPHNTQYKDQVIRSYYNLGNKESAYKYAESLLMDDPRNGLAIDVMCRKAYEEKNWKNLEKWGAKGFDLDSTTSFQAELAYFYSKGLYENGKRYDAQEVYEKAIKIDGEHRFRDIFTIIGGTPCRIKSIKVENTSFDGTIINKAGTAIYSDNTRYLTPVVEFEPLRSGDFEFKIKLFANGKLQHGEDDNSDYSYKYKTLLICDDYDDGMMHFDVSDDNFRLLTEKDTIHKKLGGWGSDEPGTWGSGGYRIEVWWENERLTTYSFNIYSGYWHNLGYGNRFD